MIGPLVTSTDTQGQAGPGVLIFDQGQALVIPVTLGGFADNSLGSGVLQASYTSADCTGPPLQAIDPEFMITRLIVPSDLASVIKANGKVTYYYANAPGTITTASGNFLEPGSTCSMLAFCASVVNLGAVSFNGGASVNCCCTFATPAANAGTPFKTVDLSAFVGPFQITQ